MSGEYGYRTRTDPSSRLIPSNEPDSRVGAPLRTESRPVVAAVKDPPAVAATTPPEELIQAYCAMADAQRWTGANLGSLSGGAGTETIGWLADVALYGRRLVLTGSPAVAFRCLGHSLQPEPLVDPADVKLPAISRIEDVCMATWTNTGAGRASAYFWIRAGSSGFLSSDTNLQKGIGFRARATSPATPIMHWAAYVGDGATAIVDVDLGIASNAPHVLTLELDADAKCVRWYIDDVLKYTWTPAANGVPDINTNALGDTSLYGWEQNCSGAGVVCNFYHWLGPLVPVSSRIPG